MGPHLAPCTCLAAVFALSGAACAAARPAAGVAEMQGTTTAGDELAGWRHYDAGRRLVERGRTGEAVLEYGRAEDAFGDRYLVERSMAIYGRARALNLAGRCAEAYDAYHKYADFVRDHNPQSAKAALSVAESCQQVPADDAALTGVAVALRENDYERALALVERIQPTSRLSDAWRNYDLGAALVGLHRVDEALAAFETAEQRFDEAGEGARGAPLVEWSKARAFTDAGRCDDARRAYGAYARLVRQSNPTSVDWPSTPRRPAPESGPRGDERPRGRAGPRARLGGCQPGRLTTAARSLRR